MKLRNLGWMAGGAAVGLLLWFAWSWIQALNEEERPPIIVQDGSFEFTIDATNATKWKEKRTGKRLVFKLDHFGKDVGSFTVRTSKASSNCNGVEATHATMDYVDIRKQVHTFRLDIEREEKGSATNKKLEPVADAPPATVPISDKVLAYGTAGEGYISYMRITGNGNDEQCTFSAEDKPLKITFTFR